MIPGWLTTGTALLSAAPGTTEVPPTAGAGTVAATARVVPIGHDTPGPLMADVATTARVLADVPAFDRGSLGAAETVVPGTVAALPVGLSFLGPAWSEARLLGFGYACEAAAGGRITPTLSPSVDTSPAVALLLAPEKP